MSEEKEAIRIMHEAIDEGVTFFDNSWDYHDGGSEEVMGKVLATGGRRGQVFLMTKVCARSLTRVSEQEMTQLIAKMEQPGSDGKMEPWKTTDYGCGYHHKQHEGA